MWTITPSPNEVSGAGILNGVTCVRAFDCVAVGYGNTHSLIVTDSLAIPFQVLPLGSAHLPYDATLVATGGMPPYSWKITSGSLPKGLRLNKLTGLISGTPSKNAATSTFTVEVHDAKVKSKGHPPTQSTAARALSITITP